MARPSSTAENGADAGTAKKCHTDSQKSSSSSTDQRHSSS
jgi:hypothetical protein